MFISPASPLPALKTEPHLLRSRDLLRSRVQDFSGTPSCFSGWVVAWEVAVVTPCLKDTQIRCRGRVGVSRI